MKIIMSPSTSTNDRGMSPVSNRTLPGPLKAGAFWAAVLMPLGIVGLLLSGLETNAEYFSLLALVVTNVIALVAGHGYGR